MPKIVNSLKFVVRRSVKTTHSKGFTLIELLVVISIIGILAAFAVASFSSAQARARDAQRRNDLVQLQKALVMYMNDFNAPPPGSGLINGSDTFSLAIQPNYMKKVPVDPRSGNPSCGGNNAVCNYYYAPSMWCADGTTTCPGYGLPNFYTYLETNCTDQSQTGDGYSLFGWGCPHFMKAKP